MDAKQFLAEFGHIANAPGGIARLRELVLAFAVQGKLIPQNSNDEPACEQLKRIKQIAAEKPTSKRRKKSSSKVTISNSMKGDLPAGWAETRLCDLLRVLNGRAYSKPELLDSGTPVLRVGNLFTSNSWYYSNLDLDEDKYCDNGDLLYAWSASFGPFIWQGTRVIFHYHIWKLDFFSLEEVDKQFLYVWLLEKTQEIKAAGHGISMAHMTKAKFEELVITLPPLEEQSRIVAKVDELMALCDQLEAQQQERRTLQNQLRQATLQAVAASQSPHELKESWQRLQSNFGELFSAPEDVVAYRGLILDLAVSGNLSDIEYRHHSTGAELLKAIAEKRIAWSNEAEDQEKKEAQTMLKKLRTQKVNFPETGLPEHWSWATFLQVSQAIVDCHNKTAPYVAKGIHLVRTTDIRNGEMNLTNTKKITEETFVYWAKRMEPKAGDIFFTREAPMGEAALVPDGEKVCLGQRTMLLRLFPELFNNRFLLYVIRSPSFQTRMVEAAIGMTVKHLRVGGVEDLVVPVPPKQEQDAIVKIIDALFAVCDRFEKLLSNKQRVAENLVSSSVASITGIAIEQEEEPMKAPQTELVAPVRIGAPADVKAQAPLATILARHNGEMSAKDLWQRFGGDIDVFYAQLKTEVAHGWILEPKPAEMREKLDS